LNLFINILNILLGVTSPKCYLGEMDDLDSYERMRDALANGLDLIQIFNHKTIKITELQKIYIMRCVANDTLKVKLNPNAHIANYFGVPFWWLLISDDSHVMSFFSGFGNNTTNLSEPLDALAKSLSGNTYDQFAGWALPKIANNHIKNRILLQGRRVKLCQRIMFQ